MDQDEGRDQDRVGRDQMELDRQVVGQGPVDDQVVARISESSQCGTSVPLVTHAQDACATAEVANVRAIRPSLEARRMESSDSR